VQVSADGRFPSFHVVAFSLPGYGFSEAPRKPGFVAEHYAEIGNKLMIALGYKEYGMCFSVVVVLSILNYVYSHSGG